MPRSRRRRPRRRKKPPPRTKERRKRRSRRRRRSESLGDRKFSRAKFERPSHPWEAERIKGENELLKKYGLKNKKELWCSFSALMRSASHGWEGQIGRAHV